jgi:hypothetical protein
VGPWYLEWSDSGLIVPKRLTAAMSSRLPICWSCDLAAEETIDSVADKLAAMVTSWNVTRRYRTFHKQNKSEEECNGWTFVEAALGALGAQ